MATLTATYDSAFKRVGLQIGGFVDGTPVTITRDGVPVRGGENVIPSSGSFFVWDYEAPFGQTLNYVATDNTLTASASTTIPVTSAMLRAPGLPSLDLDVLPQEVPNVSRPRPTATLRAMGRSTPVVLTGTRSAGEFTLSLWTQSDTEAEALLSLIEETPVGLLVMPGARAVDHVYVALGDAEESPLGNVLRPSSTWTLWTVACTVVDSPVGTIFGDPTASYQAILDAYATYTALKSAKTTYLDVLRGV